MLLSYDYFPETLEIPLDLPLYYIIYQKFIVFCFYFSGFPPTFLVASKTVPVDFGDIVTLTCSLSTSYNISVSFSWSLNGNEIAGVDTPTLVIAGMMPENAGLYQCTATRFCGTRSATLQLHARGMYACFVMYTACSNFSICTRSLFISPSYWELFSCY